MEWMKTAVQVALLIAAIAGVVRAGNREVPAPAAVRSDVASVMQAVR
jgi:hypothetical protein